MSGVLLAVGGLLIHAGNAAGSEPRSEEPATEKPEVELIEGDVAPTKELISTEPFTMTARAQFGLPTDPESMRQAVDEAWDRPPEIDPLGVPLTDFEVEKALEYHRLIEEAQPLRDWVQSKPDVFAEFIWNYDILEPAVVVQIATEADADILDALSALVPDGLDYSVSEVRFNKLELDAVVTDYSNELDGGDSRFGIVTTLETFGLKPNGASYTSGSQDLTVFVDLDPLGRTNEELMELVTPAFEAIEGLPGIDLVQSTPPVEEASRVSAPGPAVGGLLISDGVGCSSGFAARRGGTVYMLTAGHCTTGNNLWWHHSSTNGVNYGRIPSSPTTLSENINGNQTTTWAEDHGFIEMDGASTGIAIEQTMQVSPTTGAVYMRAVTSRNTTDESNSGTVVCREGASPYHSQIPGITSNYYRSFCGQILGRSPLGEIRYNQPSCKIDSGGAVHNNAGRAYGLHHGSRQNYSGTQCGAEANYVRIDTALAAAGASIVSTSAPNNVMFQSNISTHKCISASGSGVAHYTRYLQWTCLQDHYAQDFRAEPVNSLSGYNTDHYRFVRYAGNTKYCLSIDGTTGIGGNGTGNYSLIHSWTCLGSSSQPNPAQVWKVRFDDPSPQGYMQLIPRSSTSKCLSVSGSSTSNGAALHLWTCSSGSPAKVWKLR